MEPFYLYDCGKERIYSSQPDVTEMKIRKAAFVDLWQPKVMNCSLFTPKKSAAVLVRG